MSNNYLRRYTDMPALLYLLNERKITLLDPESWDDSNDSHYLALYQKEMDLESVLVLCFTQANETYHHWRVFANGSSGVCIQFKRAELLEIVKAQPSIRAGAVKYRTLPRMRKRTPMTRELPFLKRYAYEQEDEFRIVYESETEKNPTFDIAIPLSCIERITLSPWVPLALSDHIKRTLKSIKGCSDLKIARSTLIGNEEWKRLGESAAQQQRTPAGRKFGARR